MLTGNGPPAETSGLTSKFGERGQQQPGPPARPDVECALVLGTVPRALKVAEADRSAGEVVGANWITKRHASTAHWTGCRRARCAAEVSVCPTDAHNQQGAVLPMDIDVRSLRFIEDHDAAQRDPHEPKHDGTAPVAPQSAERVGDAKTEHEQHAACDGQHSRQ